MRINVDSVMSVVLLERHRISLFEDIARSRDLARHSGVLLATTMCGGSIYGAVLGSWQGSRLATYDAIKIPLLLLSTAFLTALFNWTTAALLGLSLRAGQAIALTLAPLSVASLVLASLAPVAWLFTSALPTPTPLQQTLHNILYLVHTSVFAVSGIAGTSCLQCALVSLCNGDKRKARWIRTLWTLAYAFVAGEIAWILRPFLGSVFLPVVFLRDDAFHGNVYEFILTDIVPHLWRLR